ncbi:MAG: 50S ribosomal protein L6 [Methylococcales bacterium]|nr:50S ribosomal protein L6 [Methylococcales bacterium]
MSRVANAPINIPNGVDVNVSSDNNITVKGANGELSFKINQLVNFEIENSVITVKWNEADKGARAQAGTARAVVNNMVDGVSKGFEKKLNLVGVGYRAQVNGNVLSLALGFSHPVEFPFPLGIVIEAPSQTEIIVKGSDKQKVGQAAAKIRAYRPPEPYKGKGVKYADEVVVRKEAKKK